MASEVLSNDHWRIDLDPATLAISATPTDQTTVQASTGVSLHRVSALKRAPQRIDWQWNEGAWHLSAQLDQQELLLTIQASAPGELAFLRQPGSAMGNGLIWPLAEGHYIPRGNAVWQSFLVEQGEFDTTQDLSLPLWGTDHGAFTLNWIIGNPYNNRLKPSADGQALSITARHEFTSLDHSAPMTFSLYLGDADPLAGAKRYRQWLIKNGTYQTLEDKLLKTPHARTMLGASHIYLWGNDLLGQKDVRSWTKLVGLLSSQEPLATRLRAHLGNEALQLLVKVQLDRYQKSLLLAELNQALNNEARKSWQGNATPNMDGLASRYATLRAEFSAAFASALTPGPQTWGDTLSLALIEQLESAGLRRLWLGLTDGWEGGLWHPETIRAAVQAGYLIAPYDSYETALSPKENPDWVTAHLGPDAHRDCAIVLKDATFKRGFQQSGHYTDPRCVRPLLEARIKAVQAAAGFNSWFLDTYATGMVFDSYRPQASMTQAQNAEGNVAAVRWITDNLALPTGSEGGNAVAASGVLFAHGMQTPVIGWGDPDLSKNRQSPWFLGIWYPARQPGLFFKPVPLKEPYLSVHFNPATRLPLYQAAFHGSVITTHHWLFDSFKLSNVQVENELTQLLYNVPPLYHLSADTREQRLPSIKRQALFFRPLHERLATQALTDFRWLTADRLVQQTTFTDGTRLVANFASHERKAEGTRYPAHSITVFEGGKKTREYMSRPTPSGSPL